MTMKKLLVILLVGLALTSCTVNDDFEELNINSKDNELKEIVAENDGNGDGTSNGGLKPPKD